MLGFFTVLQLVGGFQFALDQITFLPEDTVHNIGQIIVIIFLIAALIVFIDFIGQGFLKMKKWTSKIYFPIYWIFSKLTLSFLYRPLAYNFLDNKFGRRLSFWLIPIYLVIVILTGFYFKDSSYLSNRNTSSEKYAHKRNYDDELVKETEFTNEASIPSKIIQTSFLKVFMIYNKNIEDYVLAENNILKSDKDTRELTHDFIEGATVTVNDKAVKEAVKANHLGEYLKTVNQLYKLKIDSLPYKSDFIVATNKKDRLGFETYLNIKSLSQGKHMLTITGPAKENQFDEDSKTIEKILVTIPFWHFHE